MTATVTATTPVDADEVTNDPLRPRASLKADIAAVLLLALLTLVAQLPLITGGSVVGMDNTTFFFPMYSFLGEQLRSGNIPGWNPWHLSGVPFAADPQSGWMYAPAMVFFTLLALDHAVPAFIVFTALLCTLGMYALARVLGMHPIGAVAAAVAYGFTGFTFQRNLTGVVYAGVGGWLPLLIITAEMGLRARSKPATIAWIGAGGVVLSQLLAVWLGQGTYYALLALGGYLVYRTLISPPERLRSLRSRCAALLLHGPAMIVAGFALGAAGLLPRIEYNFLSNLAGGYGGKDFPHWSARWSLADWPPLLVLPSDWYVGSAVLALGAMAPLLAGRRYAVPFWSVLALVGVLLSNPDPGPVQETLYTLLPGFAGVHLHNTDRAMQLLYPAIALLAGASVQSLLSSARARLMAPTMVLLTPLTLLTAVRSEGGLALGALALASVVLAMLARLGPWRSPALGGTGLVLGVFCSVFIGTRAEISKGLATAGENRSGYESLHRVEPGAYYAPSRAAHYLRSRDADSAARFFGYDPTIRSGGALYRYQYKSRRTSDLLVNNRGIVLGLADVQGYNPVHLARYDDFVNALNGRTQEYRGLYVLREGLRSPLLDMLNARYVITTAEQRAASGGNRGGPGGASLVYEDERVAVYERTTPLPRAWIVHRAAQVAPGAAMGALARPDFDPRTTAILEDVISPLGRPGDGQASQADMEEYTPDYLAVRTKTAAAGLLVLSEPHYPAWRAYVDGKPVPSYVANHVLRAVPVPEGTHRVELRFESWTLTAGLMVSAVTFLAFACVWVLSVRQWFRRDSMR